MTPDQALHIRQHDELPVYERLGDVREKAVTMGKIADILEVRGDLDQALRIRQHDELPVHERLGDVRSKATTLAKIALLRLQQADATSRSDATELLAQAYRAFTRMRLPEAETVRQLAERHGLSIDGSEPP